MWYSGRNFAKIVFGKRIKLSFFCQVKDNCKLGEGCSSSTSTSIACKWIAKFPKTKPNTFTQKKKEKNQSESWLDFCLSVPLSGCVCVCEPKNFCHELRLGKMCEKNISKQSKSDARAIENFSHRLAEGKTDKKKRMEMEKEP